MKPNFIAKVSNFYGKRLQKISQRQSCIELKGKVKLLNFSRQTSSNLALKTAKNN